MKKPTLLYKCILFHILPQSQHKRKWPRLPSTLAAFETNTAFPLATSGCSEFFSTYSDFQQSHQTAATHRGAD